MKVLNRRDPDVVIDAKHIYVGRPSEWGNPFSIKDGITRTEAIEGYKIYAKSRMNINPFWLAPLLDAEALVCWCAPLPCHADVLVELINANYSGV